MLRILCHCGQVFNTRTMQAHLSRNWKSTERHGNVKSTLGSLSIRNFEEDETERQRLRYLLDMAGIE